MKLGQLLNIIPALESLWALKLPAKVYYRTVEAMRIAEFENIKYQEARLACVKKYGEPVADKPDHYIVTDPDKRGLVSDELNELLDIEVDVKSVQLADVEKLELDPANLHQLVGTFIIE